MLYATPAARADSAAIRTKSAVSEEVIASGFSHSTCLPARSTAAACAKCKRFGVARCTESTAGSASTSSSVVYPRGKPSCSAARCDLSGDEPTIPATCTPARRNPSTCTGPMNPVPTTTAESRFSPRVIAVYPLLARCCLRSPPTRLRAQACWARFANDAIRSW